MKNYIKNFLLSLFMIFALVGCGLNSDTSSTSSILLNGSTSMKKLSVALSENFMQQNQDISVQVEYTGSGAGIQAVVNGTANIGNSSRELKQEELDKGLISNTVAIDGIAIVTDKQNIVDNLTIKQLEEIFTGKIKNWSEVGGEDQNIVVIGRESGSGTRSSFEEILNIKDTAIYSQEIDSTGAVIAKIASIPGAIGYASLDVTSDDINVVSIEGVYPTEETIEKKEYTLSRNFNMVTNGEISQQSEEVIKFFEFINSEEGKNIIRQVGLVPVN